ncbi:MAG TPA: NAD(P)H-quinone oxidoreductase, partial [Rhodospirillales bacterium]|nr:NAD(P)H-quinone oxidoreductase [Rhodospirillales bacterium]
MNAAGPIPEAMTCIEITSPGGPEVLRPARRPVPAPGADEVLIRVAAAGINGPDIYQRQGLYPAPPGA